MGVRRPWQSVRVTTEEGSQTPSPDRGHLPFGGRYTAAVEAALRELFAKALAKGLDPGQIHALIETLPFASMLDETADAVHATLADGVSSLIESLDDGERGIEEALAEVWGPADRLYRAFVYTAYELGATIARASERHPPTTSALIGLQARAVRVAAEVRHLAMGGFASGAIGRGRSLHDLAVVSVVLREAPDEIAERYLAYSHIERRDDLETFQKNAAALNRTPFTDAIEQEVKAAAEQAEAQWGPTIRKINGWAAPLFPKAKGNTIPFRLLEERAGLGHLRPFYRLGNHHVHAGPRASELNMRNPGGPDAAALIIAGPTVMSDIGETCHGAMISLEQSTVALCNAYIAVEPRSAVDLTVSLKAAVKFVEKAGPAYGDAAAQARARGWFTHGPDDK